MRLISWLIRLCILVGILAGIVWGAWGIALDTRFRPTPPVAQLPPPQDLTQSQAQDLQVLRLFLSYDETYRPEALAKAEALIDAMRMHVGKMSRAELELGVAELVALSGNSQTRVDENVRALRFNRLPIRLARFGDGIFVVQAQGSSQELVGRRLVRINERPVDDLINQLLRYASGSGAVAAENALTMIESPDLLVAAKLVPSADGLSLTLSDPLSGTVTRWVDAIAPSAEDGAIRGRRLLAGPTLAGWSLIPELPTNVLWLHEPALDAFAAPIAGGTYLRLTPADNTAFVMAINAIADDLAKRKSPFAIVDMRQAQSMTEPARLFLRNLPSLLAPGAPIILLQSNLTRGDALIGLAHLRAAAGAALVAVGGPPGDGLVFYGEGNTMCLPNSRICLHYATARHDLTRACTDPRLCYWPDIFAPVAVASLDPTLSATLTFADYISGRDPLLERALDHLKASGTLAP